MPEHSIPSPTPADIHASLKRNWSVCAKRTSGQNVHENSLEQHENCDSSSSALSPKTDVDELRQRQQQDKAPTTLMITMAMRMIMLRWKEQRVYGNADANDVTHTRFTLILHYTQTPSFAAAAAYLLSFVLKEKICLPSANRWQKDMLSNLLTS